MIGTKARQHWILLVLYGAVALPAMAQPVPRRDDPAADGWDTEVFSAAVESQLKRVSALLLDPAKIGPGTLAALATDKVICTPLRDDDATRVFDDGMIVADRNDGNAGPRAARHRGKEGLAEALRDLATSHAGNTDRRVKFKVFRIQNQVDQVVTRQFFSASGRGPNGSFEQHAVWDCAWTAAGDGPPRLTSIILRDFEQTQLRGTDQTLFGDCTVSVLGPNDSFHQQIMRGTVDWAGQVQSALGLDLSGYQGLAVGDANGDGLEDVYVCQAGGLPNRLFMQNLDGTAGDRSMAAGVDLLDRTNSALFIDLDNDGDQDLAVGTRPALLLMSNDGSGRFKLRRSLPHVTRAYTMAAADYDNDGRLDLYVCRYAPDEVKWDTAPGPIPYHDANNGPANYLLRNQGGWRFVDVTERVGMDTANRRFSFAAAWADFDNDGDQDLYVANDFGRNCLYRNDGGHFANVAELAGVEDIASGMSASWGDIDRDGFMDLYVSNMFSGAGGRIAYQRRFGPGRSRTTLEHYQRMARGNTLFVNGGDGSFRDVSDQAGVTMGRWAWGSVFADLNNDGWQDILVANGFLSSESSGDL